MARMPVAVVGEATGFFEHTVHLNHARAHVRNVRIRVAEAIIEGSLLTRITPEDLVIAITVERRVNVYEVYRLVRSRMYAMYASASPKRSSKARFSPVSPQKIS